MKNNRPIPEQLTGMNVQQVSKHMLDQQSSNDEVYRVICPSILSFICLVSKLVKLKSGKSFLYFKNFGCHALSGDQLFVPFFTIPCHLFDLKRFPIDRNFFTATCLCRKNEDNDAILFERTAQIDKKIHNIFFDLITKGYVRAAQDSQSISRYEDEHLQNISNSIYIRLS